MLPSFLIIGAAKAGTTALHARLARHPQVHVPPQVKEANYYALADETLDYKGPGDMLSTGLFSVTDRRVYEELFRDRNGAVAWGEASPLYLYSTRAPELIAKLAPQTKLICILRDPAERAYSAYLHLRLAGREPLGSFRAALAAETARERAGWEWFWHYRGAGLYGEQLSRYLELFDREQLLALRFEQLCSDPGGLFAEVCGFLEIDRPAMSAATVARANPSGAWRSELLAAAISPANPLYRYGRLLVPEHPRKRFGRWLRSRNLKPAPPLSAELRAELCEWFGDDISRLEQLLGWKLDTWRDPAAPRTGAAGYGVGER